MYVAAKVARLSCGRSSCFQPAIRLYTVTATVTVGLTGNKWQGWFAPGWIRPTCRTVPSSYELIRC